MAEQTHPEYRIEYDTLGTVQVPRDAPWGAQTQRAVDNFPISGRRMPAGFITALARIKWAYALANAALGTLDAARAEAIAAAARRIADGACADAFPVDVYQTGSGTSSNMNLNEVIVRLAAGEGIDLHPNDDVNHGQSSNDTVPSALQLMAAGALRDDLLPALDMLRATLDQLAVDFHDVLKTGRTHLMDALPLRLGDEFGAWSDHLGRHRAELLRVADALCVLPLGGTAIGTGVNAPPGLLDALLPRLAELTGLPVRASENRAIEMATLDAPLRASGALRGLAAALWKIANDLRWMNSGPLAGLGEIELPATQPGSSIMPGKVNPVIAESVAMVCAQVTGLDTVIALAAQSGNFQLNVMLPLVADDLDQMLGLLARAMENLARRALCGLEPRRERLAALLGRNPVLAMTLNDELGYERVAAIVKQAWAEGRAVFDVAHEQAGGDSERLRDLLDPMRLAGSLKRPPGES